MIRASQNHQMGTHSPRRGQPLKGGGYGLAPAGVVDSLRYQGLPETGRASDAARSFSQFNPHVARSSVTLRRRTAVCSAPLIPLAAVQPHCGGLFRSRRMPAGPIAHRAGKPVGSNFKTADHAFHNLIQPSPFVTHSRLPLANEPRARGFSSASNSLSRKQYD